jgi:hypothetical protein
MLGPKAYKTNIITGRNQPQVEVKVHHPVENMSSFAGCLQTYVLKIFLASARVSN